MSYSAPTSGGTTLPSRETDRAQTKRYPEVWTYQQPATTTVEVKTSAATETKTDTTSEDAAAAAAAEEERVRQRRMYNSTLVTGPFGVIDEAVLNRRAALGRDTGLGSNTGL